VDATPDLPMSRAEWCRYVATLPRSRAKQSSILQSRMAGTKGGFARHGKRFTEENRVAWISGYYAGIRAAMKWPKWPAHQNTGAATPEEIEQALAGEPRMTRKRKSRSR